MRDFDLFFAVPIIFFVVLFGAEHSSAVCTDNKNCTSCVIDSSCRWCLHTNSCQPEGTCTSQYTECCLTFSKCGDCIAHEKCGYCLNTGCRPGNKSGPDSEFTCDDGEWVFKTCPSHSGPSPISANTILLAIGIGVGAVLVIVVLVFLGLWARKKFRQTLTQQELSRHRRRYGRPGIADSTDDEGISGNEESGPEAGYSSLAPLIRDMHIQQGNSDYKTLKRIEEGEADD
eukprot:TRINITY_DN3242_c0_g1_i1.p1 TRINITY_DN3242_c0_g1~~TRINITY_DN3242_c0_g1_i1.p1  ORF type:complete len:230 (+),score=18.77 TRINITY_DN3242_c0_g1_i1:42-731(+)